MREAKQVCFVYAPGHEPTDRCSSAGPISRSSKHLDMQVVGEKNVLLDAVIIMTIQAAAGELGHAALQAATRRPRAC